MNINKILNKVIRFTITENEDKIAERIKQIISTLSMIIKKMEDSWTKDDKLRYIDDCRKLLTEYEKLLKAPASMRENFGAVTDAIGSWRRLIVVCTDRTIVEKKIKMYMSTNSNKPLFDKLDKCNVILSPMKPDNIVIDLTGNGAHILSLKLREYLEKESEVTKVSILKDQKLTPIKNK